MNADVTQWLLASDEPWTRYRALVDLLGWPENEDALQEARRAMLDSPPVQSLISIAATWTGTALRRHNDAGHPLYALSTLADFGVRHNDPGMEQATGAILAHQSPEGAFQSMLNIAPRFGGSGEDIWTWMLCDAPTLLYVALAMGLGGDERVQRAASHLASLVADSGWRCQGGPEVGSFRGPGRKADPCPIANVYALKALAHVPELADGAAAGNGAAMLLEHWEQRAKRKIYLFGVGTDFRKLKYPFVWYDILHVVDVLSRFPFVHDDQRFREMLGAITAQADEAGRCTAGSMYMAWKGWSFADKKNPSPWLTFLVQRALRRVQTGSVS
jgi:hypothetical protein